MKKKVLSGLVCAIVLCACMVALAACDGNESAHAHNYSTLKFDDESHWFECECEEKNNIVSHNIKNGECACGYVSPHSHEYSLLKNDATQHWYECTCGDKSSIESHKGGIATCTELAVCSICNEAYGELIKHYMYVPTHIKRTFYAEDDEFSIDAYIKYNKDGLIEEFSEYDVDSDSKTQRSIIHFEYDKSGNLIRSYGTIEYGYFEYDIEYEYENGLLTKETFGTATTIYSYNEIGQCISKKTTYSTGLDFEFYQYEYDDAGKLIREYYADCYVSNKETEYDTNGNLKPFTWYEIKKIIEYTYDENGNEIKQLKTETNGEHNTHHISIEKKYNENNKLIESKEIKNYSFDASKSIYTNTYEYSSDGNLTKLIYLNNLSQEFIYKFAYDPNGNLLKEIHVWENAEYTNLEYSYEQIRTSNEKIAPVLEILKNEYSIVLTMSEHPDK